jgi:hypothetical protein
MAIENCFLGILIGDNGCTVLAVADAVGSAVIYAGKTVINTVDAITPDIVNKKKWRTLL